MNKPDSRLVEVIASFSKREWVKFCGFVRYKLGAEANIELELLGILDNSFPDFRSQNVSRPALMDKFPAKFRISDARLRRAMTTLHTIASEFLKILGMENPSGDFLLLSQYTQRGLDRHFSSLSNRMVQSAEERSRDLNWYFLDHRLSFEIDQQEERLDSRRPITGLQGVSDKLDTYYVLTKLKQACAMFSYQRVTSQKFEVSMLDSVLTHLEAHPPKEPLIEMYLNCVLMMKDEAEPSHYRNLRTALDQKRSDISKDEIRDLHVLARNHCIRSINLGDSSYLTELLHLYRLGLAEEILQTNPAQFAPSFKNIVSVSIKLREFVWAEKFIQDYATLLGPKFKPDHMRYNLALLNFAQGQFEACRAQIHGEHFTDLFIKLNVRVLLVKTYFELGQIDHLDSQLESFKQFLHRNKQLSYHRKNCSNLIRFVRAISNLSPGDQDGKARLKSRIEKAVNISEWTWLLKKVDAAA